VAARGPPELPLQFVDARDLARGHLGVDAQLRGRPLPQRADLPPLGVDREHERALLADSAT
jgi:hypothetical protein